MANRKDIPVGRDNAISRYELACIWNTNDRGARHAIAGLRTAPSDDDYAILSTSRKPSGYWRSNDSDELRGFIRETEARARNIFLALKDARNVFRQVENQRNYHRLLHERV